MVAAVDWTPRKEGMIASPVGTERQSPRRRAVVDSSPPLALNNQMRRERQKSLLRDLRVLEELPGMRSSLDWADDNSVLIYSATNGLRNCIVDVPSRLQGAASTLRGVFPTLQARIRLRSLRAQATRSPCVRFSTDECSIDTDTTECMPACTPHTAVKCLPADLPTTFPRDASGSSAESGADTPIRCHSPVFPVANHTSHSSLGSLDAEMAHAVSSLHICEAV
jgi:hypothetical protein